MHLRELHAEGDKVFSLGFQSQVTKEQPHELHAEGDKVSSLGFQSRVNPQRSQSQRSRAVEPNTIQNGFPISTKPSRPGKRHATSLGLKAQAHNPGTS